MISFAEYSHLSFDGPDGELLEGQLIERATADLEHARLRSAGRSSFSNQAIDDPAPRDQAKFSA